MHQFPQELWEMMRQTTIVPTQIYCLRKKYHYCINTAPVNMASSSNAKEAKSEPKRCDLKLIIGPTTSSTLSLFNNESLNLSVIIVIMFVAVASRLNRAK